LHNVANVRREFRGTEKRLLDREVALDVVLGDPVEQALIDSKPTPGSALAAQEQVAKMLQNVEQLPEHYREVLRLRHQGGQSSEEWGEKLGRPAEAARKLGARAVELLKERLQSTHDPH